MGEVFWLTTFVQEIEQKKKEKSNSGWYEMLHSEVIKFLFCALNINQ